MNLDLIDYDRPAPARPQFGVATPATVIDHRALLPWHSLRHRPLAALRNFARQLGIPAAVVAVVVALDYITEQHAASAPHLGLHGVLHYGINTTGMSPLAVLCGLVPLLVALALRARATAVAGALVAGGTIGNFAWAGHVSNFILIPNSFPFTLSLPAPWLHAYELCNLADISILVGALLFIPTFAVALAKRVSKAKRELRIYRRLRGQAQCTEGTR